MVVRIWIYIFFVIIKSEVWITNHCLGVGHETMARAYHVLCCYYRAETIRSAHDTIRYAIRCTRYDTYFHDTFAILTWEAEACELLVLSLNMLKRRWLYTLHLQPQWMVDDVEPPFISAYRITSIFNSAFQSVKVAFCFLHIYSRFKNTQGPLLLTWFNWKYFNVLHQLVYIGCNNIHVLTI